MGMLEYWRYCKEEAARNRAISYGMGDYQRREAYRSRQGGMTGLGTGLAAIVLAAVISGIGGCVSCVQEMRSDYTSQKSENVLTELSYDPLEVSR